MPAAIVLLGIVWVLLVLWPQALPSSVLLKYNERVNRECVCKAETGVWGARLKSPPDSGLTATVTVEPLPFSVHVVWHREWELERDAGEGPSWPLARPARALGTAGPCASDGRARAGPAWAGGRGGQGPAGPPGPSHTPPDEPGGR